MPSQGAFAVVSSLLLVIGTSYAYFFSSRNNTNKIQELGGISIFNAWAFLNKRHDFMQSIFIQGLAGEFVHVQVLPRNS
jgi:hypothetical protein